MGWGERSCKSAGECPKDNAGPSNCNVDCEYYKWDRKTKPDSKKVKKEELKKVKDKKYLTPGYKRKRKGYLDKKRKIREGNRKAEGR